MEKEFSAGLVWLRRDLRVEDNAALCQALRSCQKVYCAFVFDREILDPLPRADRRVEFIRESLVDLDTRLRAAAGRPGAGLIVRHGKAVDEIVRLARQLGVQAVFTAHDYEPQAITRDRLVLGALAAAGIALHTTKDHVILEGRELLTKTGTPYTVFTPYKNAWLARIGSTGIPDHDCTPHFPALAERPQALRTDVPTLADIGFAPTNLGSLHIPTGATGGQALFAEFFDRMDDYHATRDFPAVKGPSYLGVHLRFGTVSVRRLAAIAMQRMVQGSAGATVWLSELVWREFYFQILANFPHVVGAAFKHDYDAIRWEHGKHAQQLFTAWCEGRTGYPIVDAAMAQINQSGYMHNRLRMVAASFLVKDLGIDWRWGEKYFAQHLNDFDLSANNGGWQWVASSGCDAQPYFRIFNPVSQSEKFDPQGKFIRRYLPQLGKLSAAAVHAPWECGALELQAAGLVLGKDYPARLVAHDEARAQTLARYAVVRKA
ncbi:MAG: deoxyribodipyrimidine photo-lyase [Rhodoferax sp.]|jgi:deoxyribodipyrimidine photo-lyase|nr:deoxyribodipyrimidine photo-lyase [Rhodoferax sp.]